MSEQRNLPKGLDAVILNLRGDPEVTPEVIHEFVEALLALSKERRLANDAQAQEERAPIVTAD